jgi:RNA polymerase sigma-70 factor (ECF subfamily)
MSLEELLRACAEDGNREAGEEFVRRFHSLIAVVVLRTARRWGNASPALIDDLIQETYLKIWEDRKRLPGKFNPQLPDAFYGYLKVVTTNVVHDHFRAARSQKRGSGQIEESVDDDAIAAILGEKSDNGVHREILLREIDDALCECLSGEDRERDRAIFWLYYRHGFTAKEIAALPSMGLTEEGVESVIHRLKRMVIERLAATKPG